MFPAWRVLCYSMFISGKKNWKTILGAWMSSRITVPSNICRLPIYVDKQAYQIGNASIRIMSAFLPPRLFCILYVAAHKANRHPNPEWYHAVVSGIYKISPTQLLPPQASKIVLYFTFLLPGMYQAVSKNIYVGEIQKPELMTRTHVLKTLIGTNAPLATQHQSCSVLSLNIKVVQLAQVNAKKHVS